MASSSFVGNVGTHFGKHVTKKFMVTTRGREQRRQDEMFDTNWITSIDIAVCTRHKFNGYCIEMQVTMISKHSVSLRIGYR